MAVPVPPVEEAPYPGVEVTRDQLQKVMDVVGLGGFPRIVGVPETIPVLSPASFISWWDRYRDQTVPMFISHSRYEVTLETNPKHVDRGRIVFSSAFGDFDTGNGTGLTPGEVYDEILRTAREVVARGLDHVWLCSGSEAGFHLVVFFREEVREAKYLARWESAFWRGLKNELKVRSINIQCAEPKRLRRLPFSRHVHKKDPEHPGEYVVGPEYCVPVPYQWVLDGRWNQIRDLSLHPRLEEGVRYSTGRPLPSIEEAVVANHWETFGHEPGALHPDVVEEPRGSMADLLRVYIPDRRCLQVLPFGSNPRHQVRLSLVHELIAYGMSTGVPFSADYLTKLIIAIGREARWEDLNEVECTKQVRYAVANPYIYDRESGNIRSHAYSCARLRENGVCVGPHCRVFRFAFPVDWAEYLKTHPGAA